MKRRTYYDVVVQVTAILCLTVIVVVALSHGIDSVLVSTVSAIIGGIAGYKIHRIKVSRIIQEDLGKLMREYGYLEVEEGEKNEQL